MSPSAKGTLQVSESSNQLNPNIKTVMTPPIEGGTEHKDVPEQPAPQIPEQKGLLEKIRGFVETRRGKVTVGIAGVALAGGITGGVWAANSGKAPEKTSHSTSAPNHTTAPSNEASASATPAPVENTPIPSVTPVEMPAELKPYQAMDIDTFKNIPENERIKYWAQIVAGNEGMRAFAADYYRVSGDSRDKLPETISENNTPQEIATIIAYGQRVPFSLTGEDRQKALLAGLYTGDLSSRWQSGNNALTADPEGETGGAIAYNKIVDPFTATSTTGVQHANNETFIDLELKSDDGNTSEARAYFLTTEYNGQPVSWWVIQ